ncbi:hypothetical protein MFUL124B02_36920 [Myxococcus fulvus 124B02]|nr:hypothetical protein MFUL124B02_36920 [Myxococcus fulvus 124B02]
MRPSHVVPVLLLALSTPAFAEGVTFEYTDVEKCPREASTEEEEGSDMPLDCPAPGGEYTLTESYSAYDYFRRITLKGDSQFSVELRPKAACPVARFSNKVEWRMKDGKPFAVIQRVTCHALNKEQSGPGKKLGEYLVVRGLKGHTSVSGEVPTKTAAANTKARALADSALQKR